MDRWIEQDFVAFFHELESAFGGTPDSYTTYALRTWLPKVITPFAAREALKDLHSDWKSKGVPRMGHVKDAVLNRLKENQRLAQPIKESLPIDEAGVVYGWGDTLQACLEAHPSSREHLLDIGPCWLKKMLDVPIPQPEEF